MNRKAGASDLFIALILAFTISVILVMLTFMAGTVESELLELAPTLQGSTSGGENMTEVVQNTIGAVTNAYESLKWISVMLIVGLFLSVVIHSFLVNTKPVFWVSYFLVWMLAYIVAVPISNAYETLMQNKELASTFAGFVGQNFIMLHLPTWILVIGFVSGIVLFLNFVRVKSDGGGSFG